MTVAEQQSWIMDPSGGVPRASPSRPAIFETPPEALLTGSPVRNYWKDQTSPIRLRSVQGTQYFSDLDGHPADSGKRDPRPYFTRVSYVPPEFLTRACPETSAVLTLRSLQQHDTDTNGLARPSPAEKEKRKPRLHLMGLKR